MDGDEPQLGPTWRVRRTGGVLVPGFRKRFATDDAHGMTYLWGVPIGRFRIVQLDDAPTVQLRYVRWPVVDELERAPRDAGAIPAAGYVRLRRGRRIRFCRFRLER